MCVQVRAVCCGRWGEGGVEVCLLYLHLLTKTPPLSSKLAENLLPVLSFEKLDTLPRVKKKNPTNTPRRGTVQVIFR